MKVAVIRFSSLGDCTLLCPFLEHLKKNGVRELTVVTRKAFAELFVAATGADRVVALDEQAGWRGVAQIIRTLRDDGHLVIDAHNTMRSRVVSAGLGGAASRIDKFYRERAGLILFKRQADIPTVSQRYSVLGEALGFPQMTATTGGVEIPEAVARRTEARLETNGESWVSIAPGSRWPMKQWGVEKFAVLAERIADKHGCHLIVLGDELDKEACDHIASRLGSRAVNLVGQIGILETAAAIQQSSAFLGNDSGLMHLAEAVGVPVVALFGPTVDTFGYYPSLPASKVVERNIDCRPCSRNGSRKCPKGTQECLTEIDVGPVEKAFDDLVAKTGPARRILN